MSSTQRSLKSLAFGLAACGAFLAHPVQSQAAEVWLLSSLGLKPVVDTLVPQFERATGHKVRVQFALTPRVAALAIEGEAFDVAISSPKHIAEMSMLGTVTPGSAADVARFGLGFGVRAGAAKPDVSTPDAFKRAVLGAKSIGYVAAGSTGPVVMGILDRLGVSTVVKSKLKAGGVAQNLSDVANGATEAVLMPVPLIRAAKGVALAGALPAEFQDHIVMTAGVSTFTPQREAAEALIKFLMSADAGSVVTSKGYERVAQNVSGQ